MLTGEFTFTQSFTAKDSLSGYTLFINFTDEKKEERSKLSVNGEFVDVKGALRVVLRNQAGDVVDDYVLDQALLNEALYFGRLVRTFDNLISGGVRGQTFTLEIIGDFPENSGIYFSASGNDAYQDGALYLNGAFAEQDLSFYIYSPIYTMVRLLFLAFSAGLLLAFTVIYFCAYVFRVKKHILFLVAVLIMGTGYTALFTPYSAPDETLHFCMAYRVSNVLTNTEKPENTDDALYLRACDTDYNGVISNFYGKHYQPTISTYAAVINNVLGASESKELVYYESEYIAGNCVCYIFSGIGIAIGRWLQLSSAVTFYLGRFMNLILFAVVGMLAVRKMPFGKNILFAVALLPLTMQQVASYSYDSMIITAAFYYIATCLQLAYSKNKIRILDIVQILLCMAVFCAPKAGVYVLMAGVLPIILCNGKLPQKQKWGAFAGMAAASIVLLAIFNLHRLSGVSDSAAQPMTTYTLSNIFSDFEGFISLWMNTYFREKETLMYSLFGSDMAWVNLQIEKSFAPVFAALLILSSVSGERQALRMRNSDKLFYSAVVLLTIVGFCAAAYLWTTLQANYVEGLQARYIIPVLPLILLLLRNRTLVYRKDLTAFITTGLVVTNIFYIVDALNIILISHA